MKKLLILAGIVVSAGAVAQAPTSGSGGSSAAPDPNQTVCRNIADTSSRVSRTRVCMTRARWEERRRDTRSSVDRPPANSRNERSD
jgi:hypothetical protein